MKTEERNRHEFGSIAWMLKDLGHRGLDAEALKKKLGLHEHLFLVEFPECSEHFTFLHNEEFPSEAWIKGTEQYILEQYGRSALSICYRK